MVPNIGVGPLPKGSRINPRDCALISGVNSAVHICIHFNGFMK